MISEHKLSLQSQTPILNRATISQIPVLRFKLDFDNENYKITSQIVSIATESRSCAL